MNYKNSDIHPDRRSLLPVLSPKIERDSGTPRDLSDIASLSDLCDCICTDSSILLSETEIDEIFSNLDLIANSSVISLICSRYDCAYELFKRHFTLESSYRCPKLMESLVQRMTDAELESYLSFDINCVPFRVLSLISDRSLSPETAHRYLKHCSNSIETSNPDDKVMILQFMHGTILRYRTIEPLHIESLIRSRYPAVLDWLKKCLDVSLPEYPITETELEAMVSEISVLRPKCTYRILTILSSVSKFYRIPESLWEIDAFRVFDFKSKLEFLNIAKHTATMNSFIEEMISELQDDYPEACKEIADALS